jgi:hypothetical protein
MDSGILMIQDSILVCSPDPRIPHTAHHKVQQDGAPSHINPQDPALLQGLQQLGISKQGSIV